MLEHLGETVSVRSVEHPISHLVPFFYSLPGIGIDGQDLCVRVSFSCHVFSEKAEHGQPFDLCGNLALYIIIHFSKEVNHFFCIIYVFFCCVGCFIFCFI